MATMPPSVPDRSPQGGRVIARMHLCFLPLLLALAVGTLSSCDQQRPASDRAASQARLPHTADRATRRTAWIRMYEERNGEGEATCSITVTNPPVMQMYKFSRSGDPGNHCPNDHAKSVVLENLPAQSELWFYADPDCNKGEDWNHITVTRGPSGGENTEIMVWEMNLDIAKNEADPDQQYYMDTHDGSDDKKRRGQSKDVGQGGVGGNVSCLYIDIPAY